MKRRHQMWHARIVVPLHLRDEVGQRELTRSLKTRDLTVARQRSRAVLAELQAVIDASQSASVVVAGNPVLSEARVLRREVVTGRLDLEQAGDALDATVDKFLEAQAAALGVDDHGRPAMSETAAQGVRANISEATDTLLGRTEGRLSVVMNAYLKETGRRVTVSTLASKTRHLSAFQRWLATQAGDLPMAEITRRHAGRYVTEALLSRTVAAKTAKIEVANLGAYWAWAEMRGEVPSNIWAGLSKTVRESTRGTAAKRRAWAPAELFGLLQGLPEGDVLLPMTVLAAYTGCRLNELGDIKVADVASDSWRIVEGKTAAAVRFVPLSPVVRPLVANLVAATTDGFLFPGLLSGGLDNKRGWNAGKRFGLATRRLKFTDPGLTFHSLRSAFITQCEAAGIAESTVQLIVGHARQGLAFGTYSTGIDAPLLQAAVAKVSYGTELDRFATALASTFALKTRSYRRSRRA